MGKKQIQVQDHTGENRVCNGCGHPGGLKIQPHGNRWLCEACISDLRAAKVEKDAVAVIAKRKLKRKGRNLKGYIIERFENNDEEISVATLGQEVLDRELTRQTDFAKAKQSVSITICGLRKAGFPIYKVKRGVFKGRKG